MTVVSVIGEGGANVKHVTGGKGSVRLNETAKKANLHLFTRMARLERGTLKTIHVMRR